MAGVVGIYQGNQISLIEKLLPEIAYRGKSGKTLFQNGYCSLGMIWNDSQAPPLKSGKNEIIYEDQGGDGRSVKIVLSQENIVLSRDFLGIAPLYYGWKDNEFLLFSSEVKPLINLVPKVNELLPGHVFNGKNSVPQITLPQESVTKDDPSQIAKKLYKLLSEAVQKCIPAQKIGSLLSGGLDSSAISAIARHDINTFHTFAAGVNSAPDLLYARKVAEHIGSIHHEMVVTQQDLITILPEVIYHLESFDPLLVRSSVTNYLVARLAAEYVPAVFSGEGGDELFAGYEYLKSIPPEELTDELRDITLRLHNTALQRVDRCASAFGIIAYIPFLHPDVVRFALSIPQQYKIKNQEEKWILRCALENKLPNHVLHRRKAKFWEGAGVNEILASYAEEKISASEFEEEHILPNGWKIKSREEYLYYKIFIDCFGEMNYLDWMGRSKTYSEN
ncbi:MAG TPA: asparagine synthase [Candidatus Atribacteria bacterium]|jgi:asparagine synthase (glutamine-hydrolysing)|nr:asparagine synthase [Candidatus Atribacteria bacterium]